MCASLRVMRIFAKASYDRSAAKCKFANEIYLDATTPFRLSLALLGHWLKPVAQIFANPSEWYRYSLSHFLIHPNELQDPSNHPGHPYRRASAFPLLPEIGLQQSFGLSDRPGRELLLLWADGRTKDEPNILSSSHFFIQSLFPGVQLGATIYRLHILSFSALSPPDRKASTLR